MHFYIDTAKGPRINHAKAFEEFIPGKARHKTIKKGDKCLVFCNGTIGTGRLAYNYAEKEAIKMLKTLISELEEK